MFLVPWHRFSEEDKIWHVHSWVLQCTGMCSMVHSVQAHVEGQTPGISEVSEILLLLF